MGHQSIDWHHQSRATITRVYKNDSMIATHAETMFLAPVNRNEDVMGGKG
jgi:hypothetical protein